MTTQTSQRKRLRLIRQLHAAHQALEAWDASIRAAAVQAPLSPSSAPSPAAVLLAIVNEARQDLQQRLTELGGANINQSGVARRGAALKPSRSVATKQGISLAGVCVKACRACGRSLSAAFREAQMVADAASAKILYGPIRALEKQLWVLDPRQLY